MKRKGLVSRATEILHENDVRKTVPAIKTKLRILDDEDNESHFIVKTERKGYLFNESDVSAVLEALLQTITEAMRAGDEVTLYGIGTLAPRRMAPRKVVMVDGSGEKMLDECFIPKFTPGKYLRMALKAYEADRKEGLIPDAFFVPDDEEEDDGD